jgi:uncharacterized protein YjiS (DUF1127 family)
MEAVMINSDRTGPRWSRLRRDLGNWRRDVRMHHELMSLDDRMLRDIGLPRDETKFEVSKLFWLPWR